MPEDVSSISGQNALQVLAEAGRPMTSAELGNKGINRMALNRLVKAGVLERVARGVFQAVERNTPEDARAVWAWASLRNPSIVFCLESAAAFHQMTQGMASKLNIAVPAGLKGGSPELTSNVDARYFSWPEPFMEIGVDVISVEGVDVKVTSPERTVVDMFRYSNLAPASVRTQRFIETEAFHDTLVRYLEKSPEGEGMKKLRKVAKPLGLWERMKPQIELVAMTVNRDFTP